MGFTNTNTIKKDKKKKVNKSSEPERPLATYPRKLHQLFLASTSLCLILLTLFTLVPLTIQPALGQAAAGWSEPRRLLPYTKSPRLVIDPVRESVTYVTASGAYGVIAGDETVNWQNETYTKVGDQGTAQDVSASYDEFGTLHVVWAARTDNGEGAFNIFYNRVLKGSNNVGIYRNLTNELFGSKAYTGVPVVAYSAPQKKLFLVFMQRSDGTGTATQNPVWFSESADQGSSWSSPLKLGAMSGYNPAPPNLVVDKAGNPHIFYGVAKGDDSDGYVYHRMRIKGNWSGPEDIVQNTGANGRIFSSDVKLAPNGDLYFSWSNGNISVVRWEAASAKWKTPLSLSRSSLQSTPTVAIGANNTVWVMWNNAEFADAQEADFSVSTDNGASWKPGRVAIKNKEASMGRSFGMGATASKGKIYLVVSADQLDPKYIQQPSLFLTTIGESNINPPPPTANPKGTLPSLPSSTPVITSGNGGTPTVVESTLSPTPSVSPTPTASATPGPTGDEFEPDSSAAEAFEHSRYLQLGRSETHTLYDLRLSDHHDTDVVFIQAEQGKTYKIEVVANGFEPKLSFYRYDRGEFLGAASDCKGDQRRLCWSFTPDRDGLYYAQFTNFNGGPGSISLVYNLLLSQDLPASPSPVASPTPSLTILDQSTATSSTTNTALIPTVTLTPSVSMTSSQATTPVIANPPAPPMPAASVPPVAATPAVPTVKAEPSTPAPTKILYAEVVQATASALTQNAAAQTPQFLLVPALPESSGGRGPQIVRPTSTPRPTFTPLPTTTFKPTVTSSSKTLTITPVVTVQAPSQLQSQGQQSLPSVPPSTGSVWLLPVGLVLTIKGLLNLLTVRQLAS